MKGYIHNHTNFDQLLPETDDKNDTTHISTPKLLPIFKLKKQKPFWIRKTSKKETNSLLIVQNFNQNPEVQPFENKSDKESIPESIPQSIIVLPSEKSEENIIEENVGEQLKKSSTISYDEVKIERVSFFSDLRMKLWNKSTQQIKRENQKLVRSIQGIRMLSPKVKKNKLLINSQQKEIRNIRKKESKLWDADYEYGLSKKREKTEFQENILRKYVSRKKSILKRSDLKTMKKVDKSTGSLEKSETEKELQIVHEDYLYKRREEEINLKKIQALELKKQFYELKLAEQKIREKLLSYEFLVQRIIFLKYDIEKIQQYSSETQTQVKQQISCLKESIFDVERQIYKVNGENKKILRSVSESREKKKSSKNESSVDSKKPRYFHLFKKKI